MATPLDDLISQHPLWGWGEPGGPSAAPGAYAWFADELPALVPPEGLIRRDARWLLYVGIAPRAPKVAGRDPERTFLRPRIAYDVEGIANGSLIRTTLGCLLAAPLGLRLELDDRTQFTWGAAGEAALRDWMTGHLRASWVEHSRPWEVADMAFRQHTLPLNLAATTPSPFERRLGALRDGQERRAAERAGRVDGRER